MHRGRARAVPRAAGLRKECGARERRGAGAEGGAEALPIEGGGITEEKAAEPGPLAAVGAEGGFFHFAVGPNVEEIVDARFGGGIGKPAEFPDADGGRPEDA